MNKATIFAFIMGAAIGAAVTWRIAAVRYERMVNEELDNLYDELTNNSDKKTEEPKEDTGVKTTEFINEKPSLQEYAKILKKNCYISDNHDEEEENPMEGRPYVISPDDYGNEDGYDCESLTYYADGVLTDDWDNPIEDVEGFVGVESLNHFGENEGDEDTVYVRNDDHKRDYEILRDTRKFSDVPDRHYTVHDE